MVTEYIDNAEMFVKFKQKGLDFLKQSTVMYDKYEIVNGYHAMEKWDFEMIFHGMTETEKEEMISDIKYNMSALVEKLEIERDRYFQQYDQTADREARDFGCIVDSCIDIIKEHSDWISVNERLPEHDKPVLVWVVSKAGNAYAFKSYYENSWHLDFGEVTHWQPLPRQPKK